MRLSGSIGLWSKVYIVLVWLLSVGLERLGLLVVKEG